MILFTAWKNVWRNKTRSMVVILSITIGVFAGVFMVGIMIGAIDQRMDSAFNEEISHIHINDKNFNDNYDIQLTLKDIEPLNAGVLELEGVQGLSNRIVISAMANTATKSTAIQLIGIHPEQEKSILKLNEKVIPGTGTYFEKESRYNLAYIGHDLAKDLNIIRFRIENSSIDSLRQLEVPEEVLVKLEAFIGKRFPSQKAFTKEVKKVLSNKESRSYGKMILDEAWTFRSRSKMTLTFLDKDNVQTGGMFRIAGIYDIKNGMYEKLNVFVLNSDLGRLAGMDQNDYHQTIVKVNDADQAKEIAALISEKNKNLEIRTWQEIAPELAMMSGMVKKFYVFSMIIILIGLSFGIINAMLMVVLERTKELGMLTAIGMNKKKVFSMIMSESIFLSLVGGVVGMIVSALLLRITSTNGINFISATEGMEAMGISAHIYPTVPLTFFITVTIMIIITGILSSIYPALKALKMDPAEALRTE